ncbi:MAG: substrate-binding domain-containing protein [Methyloligellaceae bacterium]
MRIKLIALTAAVAVTGLVTSGSAFARDQINVVGSSTVFPFSTTVAEKFGSKGKFKTPKVESTGSGGGLKLFCKGIGKNHPDITNASRRIKKSEFDKCQKAGVKDIVEVVVGFDGIVVANSKKAVDFKLTREQLYLALAALVPGKDGKLVANPYKKWSEIDPSLPAQKIEVLGPPPTSGTRDAFEELALGGGAKKIAWLKELRGLKAGDKKIEELAKKHAIPAKLLVKKGKPAKGKDIFKKIAYHIREDGAYIEAGENDNLIVSKLEKNTNALGVFGFSFLDQNKDKLKGSVVDGDAPTFENIAAGKYKVSRSLFFYVKKAHVGVIPGIKEFVGEFVSEAASGDEGYLVSKGLIPLPAEKHKANATDATALKVMTGEEKLK